MDNKAIENGNEQAFPVLGNTVITAKNKLIAELESKGYVIKPNGEIWISRKMKTSVGKAGYPMVNIAGGKRGKYKTHLIHRLVAMKYLSNETGLPEVNHKDGIKTNNQVNNLEWCSRSKNISHAFKTGLNGGAWLNKSGAKHIRSKAVYQCDLSGNIIKEFGSIREAARLTGINNKTINDALVGRLKSAGGHKWKYK